jgi:hypothetical protein
MDPSKYVAYSMDSVKLRCLHNKTHQMHIAYTIDLSDPRCLQYGPHQQDVAYRMYHETAVVYSMYKSKLYCS